MHTSALPAHTLRLFDPASIGLLALALGSLQLPGLGQATLGVFVGITSGSAHLEHLVADAAGALLPQLDDLGVPLEGFVHHAQFGQVDLVQRDLLHPLEVEVAYLGHSLPAAA